MVEIGADINWKNADGDTSLLAACRRGHADTVSFLVSHGADVNCPGKDLMNPLHICARRGDAATLEVLMSAGAANLSTMAKNKEGQTALDIAKAKGYDNVYAILMRQRRGLPPQPTRQANPRELDNNNSSSSRSTTGSGGGRNNAATSSNGASLLAQPPLVQQQQNMDLDAAALLLTTPNGAPGPAALPPANSSSSRSSSSYGSKKSKIKDSAALDSLYNSKVDRPSSSAAARSSAYSADSGSGDSNTTGAPYTLIGGSNYKGDNNETTIALKSILDQEQQARNKVEAKVSYTGVLPSTSRTKQYANNK